MSAANEGVLAWLDSLHETTADGALTNRKWPAAQEARAAVAELAKCCDVTVKAFEALGRTDGVIAQLEAHRECERALIEQKAALARVQGGAK